MKSKTNRKIFIPAGLISLFLLVPLCSLYLHVTVKKKTAHLLNVESFNRLGFQDYPLEYMYSEKPQREYKKFQLAEKDKLNDIALLYIFQSIHSFARKNDTINGIQICISDFAKYKYFVAIHEIISHEEIKHYIADGNFFWIFHPNQQEYSIAKKRADQFEEENINYDGFMVCGTDYYNVFENETQEFSIWDLPKLLCELFPFKYLILFFLLVCWNVVQQIQLRKKQ